MFTFYADSVIVMLVDNFHDRRNYTSRNVEKNVFQTEGIGVSFKVSVRDEDGINEATRFVNMIFFRNVSVFYRVSDKMKFLKEDLDEYANSSNHDSCWRSDGFRFLRDLYFELCKKVGSGKRPIDLDSTEFASSIRVKKIRATYSYNEDNHIDLKTIEDLA